MEAERITKTSDYRRISSRCTKVVSKSMIVLFKLQDNPKENIVRVGYTATRKLGSAVSRNRCKRLMKAAVREVLALLELPPLEIVLIARSSMLARNFELLVQDLKYCLSTAKESVNAQTHR